MVELNLTMSITISNVDGLNTPNKRTLSVNCSSIYNGQDMEAT